MAKILLIDDEQAILTPLKGFLEHEGHTVYTALTGTEGLRLFKQHRPAIVFLDIRLPDLNGVDVLSRMRAHAWPAKVIMMTAYHELQITLQAIKEGAFEYIQKPLDLDKIEQILAHAVEVLTMERDLPHISAQQESDSRTIVIGSSEVMVNIFKQIGMLCQNRVPVLIQGETGTGKELVARMIHQNSPDHQKPFVVLDCSAVVATLLENELFGHEKGAFTGADQAKPGKLEAAGRGTLFLDEIGELPLSLQGAFLGVLQRCEYTRVGGCRMLQAQCRIIAATNRSLPDLVRQGRFKEDLYYRLKVVTLHLSPLRERLADLPDLVTHFLHKINARFGTAVVKLQDGVLDRLMAHPWTGNVRELENILVEAAVNARGTVLLLDDINRLLAPPQQTPPTDVSPYYQTLHEEKARIENALRETGWNRSEAAKRLDITRPTLRRKMRKYGITPPP